MATSKNNKSKSKRTYILIGVGLGTLGLLGFGWWYFKGRKGVKVEDTEKDLFHNLSEEEPKVTTPKLSTSSSSYSPSSNSGFPLKKGSRGALVKQAQEALIKLYGKSILPKYGADGDFGSEMTNALKSKGYKEVIDLAEFTKIISATGADPTIPNPTSSGLSSTDAVDIAKKLYINSAVPKLTPVLAELKRIKSVQEYKTVNELFKTLYLRGVRQTIVNGVLGSFSDDTSKQLIRAEFMRMGLKYDGSKWSLEGVFGNQLITNEATTIHNVDGLTLDVPEQTLLGVELNRSQGVTAFRTIDNQILYVPTKHISYA